MSELGLIAPAARFTTYRHHLVHRRWEIRLRSMRRGQFFAFTVASEPPWHPCRAAYLYRLFSRKMTFNWPRPDGPRGHQHAFVRLSVPKT